MFYQKFMHDYTSYLLYYYGRNTLLCRSTRKPMLIPPKFQPKKFLTDSCCCYIFVYFKHIVMRFSQYGTLPASFTMYAVEQEPSLFYYYPLSSYYCS